MERLGHSKFRLRRATNASERGQMSITAIGFQSEAFDQALRICAAVVAASPGYGSPLDGPKGTAMK